MVAGADGCHTVLYGEVYVVLVFCAAVENGAFVVM